jgi:hypothetical protein
VGNNPSIIDINGIRYDASTGRKLPSNDPVSPAKPGPQAHTATGKNVDGFVKHHKVTSKAVHAAPQRAKTLMRKSVSKPLIIAKSVAQDFSKPNVTHSSDLVRLKRAQKIEKSSLVSRFGLPSFNDFKIKPKTAHIPVKPHPSTLKNQPTTTAELAIKSLQGSIDQATSHTQQPPKKPNIHHRAAAKLRVSPKNLNIGAGVLAIVLIFGFVVYQNVPNIAVRVAAARAGVSANLPDYLPAGFSLYGHIVYKPGQITVSYKSNTDERLFQIKQSTSSWDSAALLENFVASNQRAYQTYQDKGKTIYIYEGSNATWVDRGIWYQIEGSSSLNSDQLLHLAGSM